MIFRRLFFLLTILVSAVVLSTATPTIYPEYSIVSEPFVRIGLIQNATTATVSTRDSSLVSTTLGTNPVTLDTTTVRFSSSPYRVAEYGIYRFAISDIETQEEADDLAANITTDTGEEVTVVPGEFGETWVVEFKSERDSQSDADAFAASITERGFLGIKTTVEKYSSPSDDAIFLSRQIVFNPKSNVRSLSTAVPEKTIPVGIQPIVSSRPVRQNMNAAVNSGLREVSVSGGSAVSKFGSLRSVMVGSSSPRGMVSLNGKNYRGQMEVFVNSKGNLTVVNVVPMEAYLLGVVPAELSLPQIEAQKAQAVAARTYAAANKDTYGDDGFDMLPTVWSQVYKGVSIETAMGTRAVNETSGIIATYQGKPINALYTSTCGGRTENSGNIYEFDEPYLRGVNCSFDGREHFIPFLIKTGRQPALIRNEGNYEFVRLASKYAVNNFLMATSRFDDDYFEDAPTETELNSWLNQLAAKFGNPYPVVTADSAKPLKLARILHGMIYGVKEEADATTLMSDSDINYQLSFKDQAEVPSADRVMLAELMRDGWFTIYSDLTIKPGKPYSRGKILRLIDSIYNKKKWSHTFDTGTAKPTEDGKLIVKNGRSETEMTVDPNAYLFRKFGDSFYQVSEVAVVGGENLRFKKNNLGSVVYLEVEPTEITTVAERMSPFTTWSARLTAAQVRARLARYVKGLGELIDIRVKEQGFSKRAIELEITTTKGIHILKGGKIRSALRLREQLFVMDKRYSSNGRVASISFTGRGWGHGIGMCQYGAYGFAQMGAKYDKILRHYYTGIELVKAY